jgi:hypothetical protein
MKGSSVDIRANSVLESLTYVTVFVCVIPASIAVPDGDILARFPHVIVYMICAAALNKIAVLLLLH